LRTITQPDVTPLVDLTFLLLIVFMITAPVLEYAVDVTPPQLDAAAIDAAPHRIVSITRDGAIYLDDQRQTLSQLSQALASVYAAAPDMQIMVRADEERRYGEVMAVMRAVRRSGLANVSFVTVEED
jgi:biopolymer transport protein ExbD